MRSCKSKDITIHNDDDFSFEEPVPVIEATTTHEQSIEEEEKSLINALSFTKKEPISSKGFNI
jgi:hypothetical protein